MARIIDRDTQTQPIETTSNQHQIMKGMQTAAASTTKFTISVQAVFKRGNGRTIVGSTRRTPITLVIATRDLECRCPKLKTNK